MTDLTKPIRRRTTLVTDHRARARERDQYVVSLYPDGTIGFRRSRCRREVVVPLAAVYILAERSAAEEARKKRRKRR